jgi:hypothetical protein
MLKPVTLPRVRAAMTCFDLAAVLLRATAVVTIIWAASLASLQVLVHSHAIFGSFTFGVGRVWLSGAGALFGCGGFLACRVLEGRSDVRRWVLYVYGFAFFVFSLVLLMEWFEVSGATGFRY